MPILGPGPSLFPSTCQCFLLILQYPSPLSSYPLPISCSFLSCFPALPGLCHRSLHIPTVLLSAFCIAKFLFTPFCSLIPLQLVTTHGWRIAAENKRQCFSAFSCAKCHNQQEEQISSTLFSSEKPNSEEFSRLFSCKTSKDDGHIWSSLCFFWDFFWCL